jgi:hypothetical protein
MTGECTGAGSPAKRVDVYWRAYYRFAMPLAVFLMTFEAVHSNPAIKESR